MNGKLSLYLYLFVFFLIIPTWPGKSTEPAAWGFYGHRLINRNAVFALPPELFSLYKQHIDFITEHAVDPDKRRYAVKHEAVRHYIDLDHWGVEPFDSLPKSWPDAVLFHMRFTCAEDTAIRVSPGQELLKMDWWHPASKVLRSMIRPFGLEDNCRIERDSIVSLIGDFSGEDCGEWLVEEKVSEHGILPYHLLTMQKRLTRAYAERDKARILKLSAEIGHYIGDAHVPLHTSKNYNGQLTGQEGIHAFWESRIPELFAESEYDFLTGSAHYIEDPADYFWQIVFDSHRLVPEVLETEWALRTETPEDRHFCFVDRLGATIRAQCPDYARAYQEKMEGMVEQRMRASIVAIASSWFTAWVDAGQPAISDILENNPLPVSEQSLSEEGDSVVVGKKNIRPHDFD